MLKKVRQIRGGATRLLGLIVPAAQANRILRTGLADEGLRLLGRVNAALQLQAALGVCRQGTVIVGIHRAQIPLGIDVQLHGMDDGFRKQTPKKRHHTVLVHVVNAIGTGGACDVVQQMAQIVEQGSGHQFVASTLLLGQMGRLQSMLQHGDRFTGVLLMPALGINVLNVVDGEGHACPIKSRGWNRF